MLGSIQSLRLQLEIRRMRQHVKQLTEDAGIPMHRSCMGIWKMFFLTEVNDIFGVFLLRLL